MTRSGHEECLSRRSLLEEVVSRGGIENPGGRPLGYWPVLFGVLLRVAREAQGMSQGGVEQRLVLVRGTLDRWERGDVDPGFGAVAHLADVYDVSLDWLAGRQGKPRVSTACNGFVDSLLQRGAAWRQP